MPDRRLGFIIIVVFIVVFWTSVLAGFMALSSTG